MFVAGNKGDIFVVERTNKNIKLRQNLNVSRDGIHVS